MDVRSVQEGLVEAGIVDKITGAILDVAAAHRWLYANGVAAPVADSALGLPQGTTATVCWQRGWASLTGFTGVNTPEAPSPPPPGVDPTFGSGVAGTQGPAAPPAVPNVAPAPTPPETREEQIARWKQHNEQARWKLPDNLLEVTADAARLGIALEVVAEAEGLSMKDMGL